MLSYFNLIFGRKQKSVIYWKTVLKDSVSKRFSGVWTPQESSPEHDSRHGVYLLALFYRLQELVGVRLSNLIAQKFSVDELGHLTLNDVLQTEHLLELYPKIKYIHRISFEEGTAIAKQAQQEAEDCEDFGDKLFEEAEKKYKESVLTKPNDYRALHNWGLSIQARAFTKSGDEADQLYKLASQKYQEALETNKGDYQALLLWGNLLLEQSSKKLEPEARNLLHVCLQKYEQSYALHQKNFQLLYNWGNALLYLSNFERNREHFLSLSCAKFEEALQHRKGDYKSTKNLGVALSKLARLKSGTEAESLFEAAQQRFRECLASKPADYEIFFNWGNMMFRQAKLKQSQKDANSLLECYQLLQQSGEKYLSALNVQPMYVEAVYNWGKVLEHQQKVKRQLEKPDSSGLMFSVSMFAQNYVIILRTAAKNAKLTITPLVEVGACGGEEVRTKVIQALQEIATISDLPMTMQQDAKKALARLEALSYQTADRSYQGLPAQQVANLLVRQADESFQANTIVEKHERGKFDGSSMVEISSLPSDKPGTLERPRTFSKHEDRIYPNGYLDG
eukprot:TRINITY_DN5854_c0_g1_i4.p1 TRINITY_DN5854_c0_g1~~TRINITY_DN5854_c0_g1_i4.p1  ORF type:complete len:564 (-),score=138.72 TRINITY_DN5854_c0_g1_i4:173-1864(-)